MEDKPTLGNMPMAQLERPPRGALATLGLFLLGNGEAIRRLAATRQLWLVGLLFTFSAGLAREYDAEDLLAEPWHLLIAPGASWAAATALWLFVQFSGFGRWAWSPATHDPTLPPGSPPHVDAPPTVVPLAPRLLDSYLAFLGLFWLTAPLAWFYGIPYERLMSAGEAANTNLTTLQLVALWRVVLMIRVLNVLYGIGPIVASIIVLLFGDALMLAALVAIPVPIFAIMGGVRLGDAERVFATAALTGRILGTFAGLVLGLAWMCSFSARRRWGWNISQPPVPLLPLAITAMVAIAWWCVWLPFTQPEQQLRHRVEHALRSNDFATGLNLLATHEADQFPPHWDPPPRVGYANTTPDPVEVLLYLVDHPMAERIHRLYEQKLLNQGRYLMNFHGQDPAALRKLVTLLERMPDASRLLHPKDWEMGLFKELERHDQRNLGADLHQRITALLARYPEKP